MTLLEKINSLTWYNNIVKLKEVLKEVSTSGSTGSSGIVDAPAIAGTGTTIMTFDEVRCHGTTIQTGNIVLQLNPAIGINKNLRRQVIDINGNGVNSLTINFGVSYLTGFTFLNNKNNVMYFDFVNGKINVTVIYKELPDTTPPTAANVFVYDYIPSQVQIAFSETVNTNSIPNASDFTLDSGRIVTSIILTSNGIGLNTNIPYSGNGLLAYTPGVNKIKDLAGNEMVAFTNKIINFISV